MGRQNIISTSLVNGKNMKIHKKGTGMQPLSVNIKKTVSGSISGVSYEKTDKNIKFVQVFLGTSQKWRENKMIEGCIFTIQLNSCNSNLHGD